VTGAEPTFTFLSVEDVISLHEDAIDVWGGTHGIRDRGLLESAVGGAMNVALYDGAADVYDIAATYAYHVAQNSPSWMATSEQGSALRLRSSS
jgi:death-on-curing protein